MLRNLLLGGASPLALYAPETGAGSGPAAPAASETTPTPAIAPSIPADGPLTVREAAESIWQKSQPPAQPRVNGKFVSANAADPADAGADPAGDTAPVEAGAEAEATDPPELPPVEPPKSWSKDDKEWFAELPPEKQARIAERERLIEQDNTRRQSEADKAKKDADAERQAIAQQRQQYEQALPQLLERLQRQSAGEFADIKTHDDVLKMASDDPFRFNRWQAHQGLLADTQREVEATQRRQADEQRKTFEAWAAEQDKAFTEKFKDFADPEKAPKLREGIIADLVDRGIKKDVLPGLVNAPWFRDAITQEIMYDAVRWRQAQKAAKAAAAKPTPAPTRPGTVAPKGATTAAAIQALEAKLAGATSTHAKVLAATELRLAKQKRAA